MKASRRPLPVAGLLAASLTALILAACSDPVPDSAEVTQGAAGVAQSDPGSVGLGDRTDGSVADYLQSEPRYRTFFTLLQQADLASETAIGDGITVFTVSNSSIRADASRLDPVLAPASIASIERAAELGRPVEVGDPRALARVLSRSLSADELIPSDLRTRSLVTSIEGAKLPLERVRPGAFTLANVPIGLEGVSALNGVVYPADGLFIP